MGGFAQGCSPEPVVETDEPPAPETDPPDTDTGGCPTPLTAYAQPDRALTWGVTQIVVAGGTGEYRYQKVAGDADADVLTRDGRVTAGGRAGDVIGVQVYDLGCAETVRVDVPVVPLLTVEPLRARVPPGTRITLAIAGGLGEPVCERASEDGTARLEGCTWIAEQPGTDRVQVRDPVAGTEVVTTYTVEAGADLDLWGTRWLLPLGARFTPKASGGSGRLDLELVGGSAVRVDGGDLVAVGSGDATVRVADRYTGQTQEVAVRVALPRAPDPTPDGTLGNTGVIVGGVDLNDDGYDDAILGFAEANVGAAGSGGVGVYLGGPDGLSAEPEQMFGFDLGIEDEGGRALALGDLDGDGVEDLAWSAELVSRGNIQNGGVFLHRGLGDGTFDEEPFRVLTGINQDDRLGSGLAVCDVNGDGLLDVAVGGYQAEDRTAEPVRTNQGAVYVWRGEADGLGPDPVARYGVVSDGTGGWTGAANLLMGRNLAAADLDGDGRCDLVATSESATLDGVGSDGVAWIWRGDAERALADAPTRAVTWRGADTTINLGRHVEVGDVDGDGTADVALSMYRHGNNDQGRVSVWLGSDLTRPGGVPVFDELTARVSVRGTANFANVGFGLAVGDADDDGLADLLIGAPGEVPPSTTAAAGHAWWVRGADLLATPVGADLILGDVGKKLLTGTAGARMGQALALVGDVDGTGDPEVAVLAGRDHALGVSLGALYTRGLWGVERGPIGLPTLASQHGFGQALAWIDVTGDGLDDLVVGARGFGVVGLGANSGSVFGYAGSRGDLAPAAWEWRPNLPTLSENDRMGGGLATTDFDGDGYPDLAVLVENDGKPTTYDSSVVNPRDCGTARGGAGVVLIHRGGPKGLDKKPTWIAHGPRANERIEGLVGGFDHDGDGRDDLLLMSTAWGGSSRGGFVVLRGQAAPPASTRALCVDPPELGLEANALLGSAGAALGDVDGDGCDEVAIAARAEDLGVGNQGVLRVLWGGGSGCGRAPAVSTFTGGVANAQAGFGLAGGGDVDGDEIPDLVVGAPFVAEQGATVGAVWLSPGWWLLDAPRESLTYGLKAEPAAVDVLPGGAGRSLRGRDASGAFGRGVALLPDPDAPFRSVVAVGVPAGDTGAGPFTGGIEVYRFEVAKGKFDTVPMALVAGEPSGLGDLGTLVVAAPGRRGWWLLAGAPTSDVDGPDLGAAYAWPWETE
jgi:hypothetical protein